MPGQPQPAHQPLALLLQLAAVAVTAVLLHTVYSKKRPSQYRDAVKRILGQQPFQTTSPLGSDESHKRGVLFVPRPSDVFVTTYAKTGTTLVTQIAHQLRTGGSMEFEEITQVVPWVMIAYDCGQDLDAEQVANPRLFKTHQRLLTINPGGKYLTTIRDPVKTMVSFYKFMKSKNRTSGMTIDQYVRKREKDDAILTYYLDIWRVRKLKEQVLVVSFEQLCRDRGSEVLRIAKFLQIPASAELREKVEHMSSLDFMSNHVEKFDDHWPGAQMRLLKRCPEENMMIPTAKVTSGHKETLSAETKAWAQERWEKVVTPVTGHTSYQEFEADMVKGL